MNNGPTGFISGLVKNQHESQESSAFDRLVYLDSPQSPKCGNSNEPLDKAAFILILAELLSTT